MADNTGLIVVAGSPGDTIRTIDRGTAKTQVVQLDLGGESSENMPVGSIPVTGTFWQTTQPVSGTFWQTTQPVSVAATLATKPDGTAWTLTGTSANVNVTNTVPVSGTFWQSTQPVSVAATLAVKPDGTVWTLTGTSANANVTNFPATQAVSIAASVAVTGTFWQSTQPVSIASMPSTPVTGTFWQTTQPVSIASMPSTPVTGTFWQTTQPVSQASQPLPTNAAQETGGNLASLVTLETQLQRMIDLQAQTLAVLQAMRLQEATAYGASVEPFDAMTDTLN
jgi:hypothetical protein